MKLLLGLSLALSVICSPAAHAAVGSVQDATTGLPTDAELDQSGSEPSASESVPSTAPSTGSASVSAPATQARVDLPTPGATVDRPWLLKSPMSPTAFVLDRNQIQVSYELDSLLSGEELPALWLGLKAGLSDSLMVGVSSAMNPFRQGQLGSVIVPNLKWNFLNSGDWSWSVEPSYGFQPSPTTSYSSQYKDSAMSLTLAASDVISDSRKLHFSAGFSRNTEAITQHQNYYVSHFGSDGSYEGQTQVTSDTQGQSEYFRLRGSVAYELRPHRNHALLLSVSPQYQSNQYLDQTDGELYGASKHYGATLGIGYHFLAKSFGFAAGAEAGPTFRNYPNRFELFGMPALASELSYRF